MGLLEVLAAEHKTTNHFQMTNSDILALQDKQVLVVGLGKTGLAVARFMKNKKAQVAVADLMTEEQLGPRAQKALSMGISLELGPHNAETFLSCDLIVVSPGVPLSLPPLEAATEAGIPIIGEIELAARYIEEPIIAITGTNGKTTTTQLVGEMLRASGLRVFVGGNIGNPLIDYVDSEGKADVIVAEISSFQLDTTKRFKPKVGVLLNISEDHLDRYSDFQSYRQAKEKLFENQEDTDIAVLNWGDPLVRNLESAIHAKGLYFNIDSKIPKHTHPFEGRKKVPSEGLHGVHVRGDQMICRLPGRAPLTFNLVEFDLKGAHNFENAAAACLAALSCGAAPSGVQRALDTFKGLHHRLEQVATVNGVQYYNDSKGTNVGAVMRSLESFDVPVILIMGGRDKGGDYALLKKLIKMRVKRLIAIGEARQKILGVLGGGTDSYEARSLEEAVRTGTASASPGDVVLLSPGCSSFDMFRDYAERGEAFCRLVENLQEP
jgi:UDP-N-acetylmuramoylalanine--D-glutamate ligase